VLEVRDRLGDLRRRDVAGFDHDHGGRGGTGERLVDRGLGLHHGQTLGHAVVGRDEAKLEVGGRQSERDQDRGRGDDRDDGVLEHGAQDALPERRLAAAAPDQALHRPERPGDERPCCGDAPADEAEPATHCGVARDSLQETGRLRREQRGKHRQRADDRRRHDEDRGQGDAREHAVAREEHAAHGGHDGQARDEHRAARGGCGDLDRVDLAGAPRQLLTLTGDVEDRVVDAHGEADEQDHRLSHVRDRQELARHGGQPERCDHRAHREGDRNAGDQQTAERHDQDQERDRQRQLLGLLKVLALGVVVGLGEATVTGLRDHEARVCRLRGCRRRLDGRDLSADRVEGAGDLERDERGVPVARDGVLDIRGAQLHDVRRAVEARDDVVDDGAEGGVAGTKRLGLDEHLLARLDLESGLVERAGGDAALAAGRLGLCEFLRADSAANHDRRRHECDPQRNRRPGVSCAPAPDLPGDALAGRHA
jgi:hypothetical protein